MKKGISIFLVTFLIVIIMCSSGCITKKPVPVEKDPDPTPVLNKTVPPIGGPGFPPNPGFVPRKTSVSTQVTPAQRNTSLSDVRDMDPYSVIPRPEPVFNHTSILKDSDPIIRNLLNTTYTGDIGLNGNAIGKELNISTGPFSITYTVHPNITSPHDVWAKLTVRDPWQNIISEGGYNRGYPNQETQTMTIYREGRCSLIIEGDFVSLRYVIKTNDPAPVVTQTPVPSEDKHMEELMRQMRGF